MTQINERVQEYPLFSIGLVMWLMSLLLVTL